MKLELKHLAGYLPYGLKGNYNVSDVVPEYKHELRGKELRTDNIDFFLQYAKPIIRPLSDLTKEIEVNGEKFVPRNTDLLCKYEISVNPNFYFFDGMGSNENIDDLPYCVIEKLYEWHFDLFSLIENNLAIDKNTTL